MKLTIIEGTPEEIVSYLNSRDDSGTVVKIETPTVVPEPTTPTIGRKCVECRRALPKNYTSRRCSSCMRGVPYDRRRGKDKGLRHLIRGERRRSAQRLNGA